MGSGSQDTENQTEHLNRLKDEMATRHLIATRPAIFAENKFPFRYWDIQRKIMEAVFLEKYVSVKSCHSSGKMELNGSPVLTPTGWQAIETLKVGDNVISGNGEPTSVLGVYPHYNQEIYRVIFKDGSFLDVGGAHLWTIMDRQGRDTNGNYPYKYADITYNSPWKTKTTKEIFDFYQTIDKNNRHLNYELPKQPVVQLTKQAVTIEPYALGLLIGDGGMTTNSINFTTADLELLKNFKEYKKLKCDPYGYIVYNMLQPLKDLKLHGTKAHNKFVPQNYLWNSTNIRLAVLQGLMDTDGSVCGGGVEFTSTSEQLAKDVQFLVRSLGGYANIAKPRQTTYTYKGKKKVGRPSYRVYIRMDKICPFRLTRKAERWERLPSKYGNRTNGRLIESVDLLPDKNDATCIMVAAEDGLYITKDFIITHNTFTAATILLMLMQAYSPAKILTTAPTNFQVEKLLWSEVNSLFIKANPAYPHYWRCLTRELKIQPDHFAVGFSSDDEINYQGLHSEHFFFIGDEAAGITTGTFNAIETLMTPKDSKMLLISNPDSISGYFYRSFEQPEFANFTISAFDTPNFEYFDITMDDIRTGNWLEKIGDAPMPFPALLSPHWVAKAFRDHGESSAYFIAKTFGEFPKGASDSLVPMEKVSLAQERNVSIHGTRQWGLDVARMGTDTSVLKYRRGSRVELTRVFRKIDLVDLTDWAAKTIVSVDENAPVVVDAVGVGAGVADMLNRQKHLNVVEYQGSAASEDDECYNQRAEFYWHLRKLFMRGDIGGNIDDATKEELVATKYRIVNGKIRISKKDDIKKILNRSPDNADALMLCFAKVDAFSVLDDLIIPSPKEHLKKEQAKFSDNKVDYWYPL